ncbi:hypothetical protein [Archangium lipolyticum]|uniref:hypothetical protein n=1 Tax=Archangium lipolyticum TaxID=2970465 RepID=UPI002149C57B|nr:hypothetical protein [Archangium lipolyticum]
MSYFDPPRIHFGGAFFAGPSTINNYTPSYTPSVPLTNPNGVYISEPPTNGPSGWNPTGLAQLYFQGCRINSVVASDWSSITDPTKDSLVGVSVITFSPDNPFLGEGVTASFPKLVDLDPDMQARSEVYGLIIAVNLPGGGGFIAWFDPPQLRNLNSVIPTARSSWGAAGAWATAARTVTGTTALGPGQVRWLDGNGSPVYESFRAACAHGIALKLTVDLHRNQPVFQLFQGDVFCYGRVQGTFGPLAQGEPSRWAPARKLMSQTSSPYKPVGFRVSRASDGSGMLSCDLGGCVPLSTRVDPNAPKDPQGNPYPLSDGSPASPDAVLTFGALKPITRLGSRTKDDLVATAGFAGGQTEFVPFQKGAITPGEGLIDASDEARAVKDCKLWPGSQVYSIPLTPAELDAISQAPVVVMLNGQPVLREADDGISGDIDTVSMRIEQGTGAETTVRTLQWGKPTTIDVSFTAYKFWWSQVQQDGQTVWMPSIVPAGNDLVLRQQQGPEPGTLVLEVSTSTSQSISIPTMRAELDSLVYYIMPSLPLGDAGPNPDEDNPLLSVLLWRAFQAPANPTWKDDVGPLLGEYARMYPGMKGRFDIGDEATVRSNLPGMLVHLGADRLHPMYMPVTRDLSPSRVSMLLQWLRSQQSPSNTVGRNVT